VLPWGYETLWWEGIPYYYADNSYYVWDNSVGEYQAVEPPGNASDPSPTTGAEPVVPSDPQDASKPTDTWTDLYAYPKDGQSTEQQQRDRDECHKWASDQTGFDPTQSTQERQTEWASKREAYLRAEGACLTARNYSVK
jgi:hypothetical protein